VDDERLTMQFVCRLLEETGRAEVIGSFINPLEAIEQIIENKPDAVFLDIEMPELNGLQLAERICESDIGCEIVFLTAYNEYALEAFKVNALDYLLKPVAPSDINRALDRVEKRRANLAVHTDNEAKVKVAALGGYSVWINGVSEPVRWHTVKCGELFAYFALQDSSAEVPKWKLVELLWPEKDSEKGDINLRSTICRLNKTLSEYGTGIKVISTRNNYYLKFDSLTVDALIIKRLAQSGNPCNASTLMEYEEAIASFKGLLFECYDFRWCEELRVSHLHYFAEVAYRLAEYCIEKGRNF